MHADYMRGAAQSHSATRSLAILGCALSILFRIPFIVKPLKWEPLYRLLRVKFNFILATTTALHALDFTIWFFYTVFSSPSLRWRIFDTSWRLSTSKPIIFYFVGRRKSTVFRFLGVCLFRYVVTSMLQFTLLFSLFAKYIISNFNYCFRLVVQIISIVHIQNVCVWKLTSSNRQRINGDWNACIVIELYFRLCRWHTHEKVVKRKSRREKIANDGIFAPTIDIFSFRNELFREQKYSLDIIRSIKIFVVHGIYLKIKIK